MWFFSIIIGSSLESNLCWASCLVLRCEATDTLAPAFEPVCSFLLQECLKSIVGFIGFHGFDDDGHSEISDEDVQPLIPTTQLSLSETQIRRMLPACARLAVCLQRS